MARQNPRDSQGTPQRLPPVTPHERLKYDPPPLDRTSEVIRRDFQGTPHSP